MKTASPVRGVPRPTASQVLLAVAGVIFLAETAVMFLGTWLPPLPAWLFALTDSVALVVLLLPVLYLVVYRPFSQALAERQRSEAAARASEEKYRELVELSPDAVFVQCEGKFAFINQAGARMLGATEATEIVGKRLLDFVPPDEQPIIAERIRQVNAGMPVPLIESKYLLPDGRIVDVEVAALPLVYQGLPAAQVVARDITQRKQIERRQRDAEALYHSLVENLPQNVFRKNQTGQLTFANQRYCELMGLPLALLIGKRDADLFPPALAAKYLADDRRVMETGAALDAVEEHETPDGKRIYVQVCKTPLKDAEGKIIGVQGIFWDVTARKAAEAERERLIRELQEALANVKTLSGLLPICAGCKKIRDDQGYWSHVENYVQTRTGVKFSHGMCPDCMKQWYPEFQEEGGAKPL